ncbi:hypothetical protein L596_020707 [Steinernema carpocapsae]|uniref:Uncharacterized protein n=1 Tax=Steinernema carpocapsae TaxID=34508 RepID=A0A4U5MUJ7_STECR|nr:hypothetical protein L596_020707 [Steinernema carpocapsae]
MEDTQFDEDERPASLADLNALNNFIESCLRRRTSRFNDGPYFEFRLGFTLEQLNRGHNLAIRTGLDSRVIFKTTFDTRIRRMRPVSDATARRDRELVALAWSRGCLSVADSTEEPSELFSGEDEEDAPEGEDEPTPSSEEAEDESTAEEHSASSQAQEATYTLPAEDAQVVLADVRVNIPATTYSTLNDVDTSYIAAFIRAQSTMRQQQRDARRMREAQRRYDNSRQHANRRR